MTRNSHARVAIVLTLCLVSGCQVRPPQHAMAYPDHWWAPVDTNGAPSWEIFPQEARPGEVILSKRNELGLLSNFAATPFAFHQKTYASLEGFWQMMKFPEGPEDPRNSFPGVHWPYTRDEVAKMTGFTAKRAGDIGSSNMVLMGLIGSASKAKECPIARRNEDFTINLLSRPREKRCGKTRRFDGSCLQPVV
jgi:hypothetical protein